MPFIRLLPLAISFIVLALFETFFYYSEMIYVAIMLIILSIFFAVWQFTKTSPVDKQWWNYLILPISFITASAAYSILLSSKLIIQTLFILNGIFIYIYLRTIFNYLLQPLDYKNFSLENISAYGNFITFFFIASTIYGLQSFLNAPIWLLMIVLLIFTVAIVYQAMWVNKIYTPFRFIYILISSLVIIELAWTISFLPFKYQIAGFVLSICYYMTYSLMRFYLLSELDKRKIRLYLGFGLLSMFIVLLTASWL